MKKLMSIILVLLCIALVLPTLLTACTPEAAPEGVTTGPEGTTAEPDNGTTAEPGDETTVDPSAGTTADPNGGGATDPDGGTTTPGGDTTVPEPSDPVEIEVVWNIGRIQSDFNNNTPEIDTKSSNYSNYMYTDVITIAKKGTEISFTDAIAYTSEKYDSAATRYDYVISSWKQHRNGTWRHDSAATNISGSTVSASPVAFPIASSDNKSIIGITYKYVTSVDNESIRLSFKSAGSSEKPRVYLTENAGVGTYQEYLNFIDASKKQVYDANLEGKTIALFGDSYLAGNVLRGEYTWAKMIVDKYGMTLYNHSIGGSTVSNYNGGRTPLVNRWDNYCEDPDIIVIECGRNDSDASLGIKLGTLEDQTTHTFRGALMYMIQNLREKYPNAMIVGVTSYNSPDRDSTIQYAKTMRDLFAHYGYPCIYAADPKVSGVDTGKQDFRTQYMEHPQDHSHLNYRGHMMAMPKLEAALSQCYADFLAGKYEEKEMPKVVNGPAPVISEGPEAVIWDNAFVASDKIGNGQEWLRYPNSIYRASNVITLTKAGTTITFKEKGVKAGNNIFAFSFWKPALGGWEIDKTAANLYASDASIYKSEGGYNVWTYTSKTDNEHIMLCYKACTTGGTPPTDPPIIELSGPGNIVITSPDEIKWETGFVGSASYSEVNQRNQLNPGVPKYTYSEILHIAEAGTKISFSLPKDTPANYAVYAISSWKKVGNDWVIDLDGANFAGSGTSTSLISKLNGSNVEYTYITSKADEYIRICYRNDTSTARPAVSVEKNAGEGTLTQYNNWMAANKALYNSENLKNLDVVFFGDSYLAGQGIGYTNTWIGILGEKYGMNLTNMAIGGSSISDYVTTNNPLVDRVNSDTESTPANVDLVIIQGGRNDRTLNVPLGDGGGATAVTTTFKGALRYMYEEASKKYPNATIVFVTAWGYNNPSDKNTLGLTTDDYANAMVEFCKQNGWYYIDASDALKSGVDINDSLYRDRNSLDKGDISHLNYFGHRSVSAFFERELDAIIADDKNATATQSNLIPVTWTMDTYVGGDTYGTKGVRASSQKYKTTELFVVAKAGTTIYFRDNCQTESKTTGNVCILTNYIYDTANAKWVPDLSYTNGVLTANDMTYEQSTGYVTWKYTTSKENEVIRLCIRCEEDMNYTAVYFTEPTN